MCARAKSRIFGPIGKAISDYSLIQPGDRIIIGVSGGKDSLFMAWALSDILRRSPAKFSVEAVTIDLGEPWAMEESSVRSVSEFLEQIGISHRVIHSSIAKVVTEYESKKTKCSLCSRLRRGCLYKNAREMGVSKVALAHHLDDAIETLLMNMFYQGRIDCFRPKTFLTRQEVEVIRPLVYVEENQIEKAAKNLDLPVVAPGCTLSGNTSRQAMKNLVRELEGNIPGVRHQMMNVLKTLWKCEESTPNYEQNCSVYLER